MYRDTEEAYKDWILDVYQGNDGQWIADFWHTGTAYCGQVSSRRRKDAIAVARKAIDAFKCPDELNY